MEISAHLIDVQSRILQQEDPQNGSECCKIAMKVMVVAISFFIAILTFVTMKWRAALLITILTITAAAALLTKGCECCDNSPSYGRGVDRQIYVPTPIFSGNDYGRRRDVVVINNIQEAPPVYGSKTSFGGGSTYIPPAQVSSSRSFPSAPGGVGWGSDN